MKILVTGGAGFIGSHVVDGYIKQGYRVVVLDNLSTGKKENLNPKAKFFKVDIRSEKIKKIIKQESPDIINLHAAQISVPSSVKNPLFDADVNITGFLNILEASQTAKIKKIIFISSGGAIYGEAKEYPTSENYPPKPLSPYAITKRAAEDYLFFYNQNYGLDYTVLRYSNVYGPRQIPHGEAGVVSIFMDMLMAGKQCAVYGFPGETKGMLRDYCYVGDVVRANILAIKKGGSEAINIGTGAPTHTLDLFNTIYDSLKTKTKVSAALKNPKRGQARPGDIRRSCLNVKKAEKILGWKARVSLEQGIDETVMWRLAADKCHV